MPELADLQSPQPPKQPLASAVGAVSEPAQASGNSSTDGDQDSSAPETSPQDLATVFLGKMGMQMDDGKIIKKSVVTGDVAPLLQQEEPKLEALAEVWCGLARMPNGEEKKHVSEVIMKAIAEQGLKDPEVVECAKRIQGLLPVKLLSGENLDGAVVADAIWQIVDTETQIIINRKIWTESSPTLAMPEPTTSVPTTSLSPETYTSPILSITPAADSNSTASRSVGVFDSSDGFNDTVEVNATAGSEVWHVTNNVTFSDFVLGNEGSGSGEIYFDASSDWNSTAAVNGAKTAGMPITAVPTLTNFSPIGDGRNIYNARECIRRNFHYVPEPCMETTFTPKEQALLSPENQKMIQELRCAKLYYEQLEDIRKDNSKFRLSLYDHIYIWPSWCEEKHKRTSGLLDGTNCNCVFDRADLLEKSNDMNRGYLKDAWCKAVFVGPNTTGSKAQVEYSKKFAECLPSPKLTPDTTQTTKPTKAPNPFRNIYGARECKEHNFRKIPKERFCKQTKFIFLDDLKDLPSEENKKMLNELRCAHLYEIRHRKFNPKYGNEIPKPKWCKNITSIGRSGLVEGIDCKCVLRQARLPVKINGRGYLRDGWCRAAFEGPYTPGSKEHVKYSKYFAKCLPRENIKNDEAGSSLTPMPSSTKTTNITETTDSSTDVVSVGMREGLVTAVGVLSDALTISATLASELPKVLDKREDTSKRAYAGFKLAAASVLAARSVASVAGVTGAVTPTPTLAAYNALSSTIAAMGAVIGGVETAGSAQSVKKLTPLMEKGPAGQQLAANKQLIQASELAGSIAKTLSQGGLAVAHAIPLVMTLPAATLTPLYLTMGALNLANLACKGNGQGRDGVVHTGMLSVLEQGGGKGSAYMQMEAISFNEETVNTLTAGLGGSGALGRQWGRNQFSDQSELSFWSSFFNGGVGNGSWSKLQGQVALRFLRDSYGYNGSAEDRRKAVDASTLPEKLKIILHRLDDVRVLDKSKVINSRGSMYANNMYDKCIEPILTVCAERYKAASEADYQEIETKI